MRLLHHVSQYNNPFDEIIASHQAARNDPLILRAPASMVNAKVRKLGTLPFATYGIVDSESINVSRNANKDEKQSPIYAIHGRIDPANAEVDGKRVTISSSMAESAEIIAGSGV